MMHDASSPDWSAFSVTTLSGQSDDRAYWQSQSPGDVEGAQKLKEHRQASGRHKDLDNLEKLP
jgi:hypothetical protein